LRITEIRKKLETPDGSDINYTKVSYSF